MYVQWFSDVYSSVYNGTFCKRTEARTLAQTVKRTVVRTVIRTLPNQLCKSDCCMGQQSGSELTLLCSRLHTVTHLRRCTKYKYNDIYILSYCIKYTT